MSAVQPTLGRSTVPALARGPVLALAAAVGLLLLATSGRHGYFGDELYFLAAGRHLDWGYADQPPLLPLLARLMDTLAPGSLVVLRLPATLVTATGVVVAALLARELGGGRKAQVLVAATSAICPFLLGTGHYLATSTLDPFGWAVVTLLLVRWVRTRADGLLVWAGVVTGLTLNVKFLLLGFWLVAGVCLLAVGPRELLRRPMLWVGALIAAAAVAPTVVWQARNGWPQLDMNAAIAEEVTVGWGGRALFLPGALLGAGLLPGVVLLIYGVVRLLRSAELRPHRFLGWTTLGLAAVFLAIPGRPYYLAGMFPVCWAAAAVGVERVRPARWWRWVPTWPVYVVSAVVAVPLSLPVYPTSWVTVRPEIPGPAFAFAELGWPDTVAAIAGAYHRIPEPRRRHAVVVTEFYWEAAAVARYGPEHGLPEPYSGHRGYWTLGRPPETADTVLYLGTDPSVLRAHFTEVRRVGELPAGTGAMRPGTGLWLATGRTEPWETLWPRFRRFSI
nr:glycosyltransferase family 39 protein [Amycolatopsis arida]